MAPAESDTLWSIVEPAVLIDDGYMSGMDPDLRSNDRVDKPLVICEIDGYCA